MASDYQVKRIGNYIYRASDDLGKGSYGEVYKCRHKQTGELAAVKLYTRMTESNETEMNILSHLDHPNVVKVLCVINTPQKALVMEYCRGKSLHHFLEEPANYYGLKDEDFILLLNDVVQGLVYLQSPEEFVGQQIVHRDIKPLNILIDYRENAQIIFKLSDFGTAKVIAADQEECQTLVGTPEYLQPDMFKQYAEMKNIYRKGRFNARGVDLWPLGLTLFTAACGHLPFKPYGPLSDATAKAAMQKMILDKKKGVISARQDKYGGEIIYSYSLPNYCRLSKHLQSIVVPLLAELIVRTPSPDFDLDTAVKAIVNRKPVQYFIPQLLVLDRLYIQDNTSVSLFLNEICVLHSREDVSFSDSDVFWKGFPVSDLPGLLASPSDLESEPLMVVPREVMESTPFDFFSPYEPKMSTSMLADNWCVGDVKYARQCCAIIKRMEENTKLLRNAQVQLSKHARYVDVRRSTKMQSLDDGTNYNNRITSIVLDMFMRLEKIRNALPASVTLAEIDCLKDQIEQSCRAVNARKRVGDEIHKSLPSAFSWTEQDCCSLKCENQMKLWAKECEEIHQAYIADLKTFQKHGFGFEGVDSNDYKELHRVSNSQLYQLSKKAHQHVFDKCVARCRELQTAFEKWNDSTRLQISQVEKAEEEFKDLTKMQTELQTSIDDFGEKLCTFITNKVGIRCNSEQKRNEIFERARLALEQSTKTLEMFQKANKSYSVS